MALGLEPLADTELVLDGTKKTGLLLGRLATLVKNSEDLESSQCQRLSRSNQHLLLTFMPRLGTWVLVAVEATPRLRAAVEALRKDMLVNGCKSKKR